MVPLTKQEQRRLTVKVKIVTIKICCIDELKILRNAEGKSKIMFFDSF